MKRREFLKAATATIALASLPISVLGAGKPGELWGRSPALDALSDIKELNESIEWNVGLDPSTWHYRISASAKINGVMYHNSYLVKTELNDITEDEVDKIKAMMLIDMEQVRNGKA